MFKVRKFIQGIGGCKTHWTVKNTLDNVNLILISRKSYLEKGLFSFEEDHDTVLKFCITDFPYSEISASL